MNENRNQTRRRKPLAALVVLTALVAILPPFIGEADAAESCKDACTLYTTCVGEIQGKQPSQQQSKSLFNGCMQTCNNGKYKQKVLQCYADNKSQNSCSSYAQCIITAAQ